MPEGDTIHRAAAALAPLLEGKIVRELELTRRAEHVERVAGVRIAKVEARGKNLLVHFENDLVLHTHMKMNGRWRGFAPGEVRPVRSGEVVVWLEVEDGAVAVCWRAPIVRMLRANRLEHELGDAPRVDPIAEEFDPDEALRRLRTLDAVPLGEAVVDQRAIAGIGNEWKSELLFAHGLDPFAPVARFADDELYALLESARKGLRRGALRGTRPSRIYKRAGWPCSRCGDAVVEMRRQGEMRRSTYYCPRCQPPRA